MNTKQMQSLADIFRKLFRKADEVHFSAENCFSGYCSKQWVEDPIKTDIYFKLFLEVLLKQNFADNLVARDIFLRFLLNCSEECLQVFAEYVRVQTGTPKDHRIQCFSRKNFGEIFGEYYGAQAFGRLPMNLTSFERVAY